MIKKIVYISYLPLTTKVKADYFMERLMEEGFAVCYLDLGSLFFSEEPQMGKIDDPIVQTISSYGGLKQFIAAQDQSTTLYLSMPTFEARVLKLHRILTRHGCLTARYGWNPIPSNGNQPISLWSKLRSKSLRQIMVVGLRVVRNRMAIKSKQRGWVKAFDLLFCCGRYGYQTIGAGADIDTARGQVVSINSSDYGLYQRVVSDPSRVVEGDYILFLDEYLPLHPDFEMFGVATIPVEPYYAQLNRFFTQVEQQTGLRVVVAAHPKAMRYQEEDFFEGRSVYFGQTAPLVKDASYVLSHGSTSLGYAAMFGKPAAVLLSQSIKKVMCGYYEGFKFYAQTLGLTTIHFDEPLQEDFRQLVQINHAAYRQYRYDYLTSPESEGQHTEDIVVGAIKAFHTP